MKRIFILLIILVGSVVFFAENGNERMSYEFVSWIQPEGMIEISDNPWESPGYYIGELNQDSSFIEKGIIFMIIIDEDEIPAVVNNFISDPSSVINSSEEKVIDNSDAIEYLGSVDTGDGIMNFKVYYFQELFYGTEEMVIIFMEKGMENNKGLDNISEIVINSIKVSEEATNIPEKYVDISKDYRLSIFDTIFYTGEKIFVEYEKKNGDEDFVGIYSCDDVIDHPISFNYVMGEYGSVLLNIPDIPGNYEVRMYSGINNKLVAILENLIVEEGISPDVGLEKSVFKPGETINVYYYASPGFVREALISLVDSMTEHGDESVNLSEAVDYTCLYSDWSGMVEMTVPETSGKWDIRLSCYGGEYDFETFEVISGN